MAKPTAAQCHALTTYYADRYYSVHGRKPVVNRNAARYGFESILLDFDTKHAKQLIDYLFNLPTVSTRDHSLTWFLYNYDKVEESFNESLEYQEKRKRLMEESAERARKWVESGQSRTSITELSSEE